MSTGSLSDAEELPEMDLRGLQLDYAGSPRSRRRPRGEPCPSVDNSSAAEEDEEDDEEEDEDAPENYGGSSSKKKRAKGTPATGQGKRQPLAGRSAAAECKQTQRNAANARERARMRVLSKAFSRLKTSLPWVPPDTKLSKLDTLRLASSYIAHLRQLLQEDRYEKGYVHPVNLIWDIVEDGNTPLSTADYLSCRYQKAIQVVIYSAEIVLGKNLHWLIPGHLWFQEDQNQTPKKFQQPTDYVELQLS